ncbi:MAG: hypothetical protein V5788_11900 [Shewanella sp.]
MDNGTLAWWGGANYSATDFDDDDVAMVYVLEEMVSIYSNMYTYAVILADGSVVTWGVSNEGGNSSGVNW